MVNGLEIAQDAYWPFVKIYPTSSFPEDVEMNAEVIAYDYFGDPIVSDSQDFEVESIWQVIINGDFENGNALWDETGDVAMCVFNPAGGQAHPAFLGDGCMAFTGPGTLSRTVLIPGDASTASLSFRFKNESPEGSAETLTLRIIDDNTGQILNTPLILSGFAAETDLDTSHKGYAKHVVDLTPYRGMDFSISFEASSNGGPLHFNIDNVGAVYTVFPIGGGPGGFQS